MLILLGMLGLVAIADQNPPGETISSALIVDIPPQGFDAAGEILPTLIPAYIEVPETGNEGGWWCANYVYELTEMWVAITVLDANITPREGWLDLDMDLEIQINDPSSPFRLYTELACIPGTCDGHVESFPANVTAKITLDLVDVDGDGRREMDATVSDLALDYTLTGDDILMKNCVLGSVLEVMDWFGLSIYELVINAMGPELESAVTDFVPEIETLIEDAFSSLYIDQTMDISNVPVNISLEPETIDLSSDGMRLTLAGSVGISSFWIR